MSGGFVSKLVKGRRYWYVQTRDHAGKLYQAQAYAGPEMPDLLRRSSTGVPMPMLSGHAVTLSAHWCAEEPRLPFRLRLARSGVTGH